MAQKQTKEKDFHVGLGERVAQAASHQQQPLVALGEVAQRATVSHLVSASPDRALEARTPKQNLGAHLQPRSAEEPFPRAARSVSQGSRAAPPPHFLPYSPVLPGLML